MGSASSKFRKHLQAGDEVQALQLYHSNSELRKALDPNSSYGDSHQHETPLHLAAKHGMSALLRILLFSKGGNPKKTNARKETCLHCVCMETNFQSVYIGKRRADCLSHLLNWRGATLSEGQIEKVDVAAQDEKLNTALHYAAASGLSQCVEILIQHGAPLFIENEDHLTPCDTAEKSGHAKIALLLESKMVFSNDGEHHGEEDNVSMPHVEEYSGLRPQDLQEAKDHLLVETADMLSVPLFTAEALLRNHEWSREMLLEAWMSDPIACCEKCGVTPPSTLFSEKPQVQENLTSPLPSPLHAIPSPQDAECRICASTFLIADEPVHMTCAHQFCKDCWERYLNVKIQEGDAHHITCPAYDCTMLVPIDIIERIVSKDMALRYLQFDIKAFVDSNPDMKWCPYPSCGRAVKFPDLDFGSSQGIKRNKIPSDTSRGVDCGIGHYFCWECLQESHEPCSCDNWSKWFQKINEIKPETLDGTEQETELAANCLWLVTNSKPCPNCKSPIQKNEGCNHMKCSKCKYDFCWVCLEQWKRHNSSTGGYFKCNRYEVLKRVEEQSAQMVSEAEIKSRNMQELNRFVHYYTRFKNHENSYKLEEPLLKTVKDKMMKLAEAVTDIDTAHAETKFVEDAVQQLLKARRVLKCSYVYGFYLDGPGYKKIVFEFMQTELEECIEVLSQMVNRLYLRTPRRKIMDQAHFVQRKRLEFIMAISKGLVPPETPPNVRKTKMRRKSGGEGDDEDLHRAIVASIQEVDPSNPWIKDASGRHTNVVALLEWPSDESEQSEGESELSTARDSIGKCYRSGCNKVRVKNPRTNEHHDYCSRWCMQADKEDKIRKKTEGTSAIVADEHMELLRALEMSRLQYMRDSGLLHVSDSRDTQQHRPRSNSAGHETKVTKSALGLNSMKELGIELQRFHELSSAFPRGEKDETSSERKITLTKSNTHHCHMLSQSSRFSESGSTVVTRVPNKSVEDLFCLDHTSKSPLLDTCQSHGQFDEANALLKENLLDCPEAMSSQSHDTDKKSTDVKVATLSPSKTLLATSDTQFSSTVKGNELVGSTFGAIKDISVFNIHSDENDKTKDFLSKNLVSILSSLNSKESSFIASSCEAYVNTDKEDAKRPLSLEEITCKSSVRRNSDWIETDIPFSSNSGNEGPKFITPPMASVSCKKEEKNPKADQYLSWLPNSELKKHFDDENVSRVCLYSKDLLKEHGDCSREELLNQEVHEDFGELSLLEISDNLLQLTVDANFHMKEEEETISSLHLTRNDTSRRPQFGSLKIVSEEEYKSTRNSDINMINDKGNQQLCANVIDRNTGDVKQYQNQNDEIREKICPKLPRTAWSIKENEEADPRCTSEANRKTSSERTKVSDSIGVSSTLPYTKSLQSRVSNRRTLPMVTGECVYELQQDGLAEIEKQLDDDCIGSKHCVNSLLERTLSSASIQQETLKDVSNNISVVEKSNTNSLDINKTQPPNLEESSLDSPSSSTKPDKCTGIYFLPSVFTSLMPDDMIKNAGMSSSLPSIATQAENSEQPKVSENNTLAFSFTSNFISGSLSTHSSYAPAGVPETENYIENEDSEIMGVYNNAENYIDIATSALITDIYKIAISDENHEDASSMLLSDNQMSINKNQDSEEVD